MKKWFAVYTKPRCEKKVTNLLLKKDFEVYCPLNRVLRVRAGKEKLVTVPLFAAWIFVRANEQDQSRVKDTEGILNFMFWQGKPAVIRDIEIDMLQRFLAEHHSILLQKGEVVPRDIVRVTCETIGDERQHELKDNGRMLAKISLPSIGYRLIANILSTETLVQIQ